MTMLNRMSDDHIRYWSSTNDTVYLENMQHAVWVKQVISVFDRISGIIRSPAGPLKSLPFDGNDADVFDRNVAMEAARSGFDLGNHVHNFHAGKHFAERSVTSVAW